MRKFIRAILVMGSYWLCKFVDRREWREQRYLAFEQDW